jgi:endonuclease/exonuclease/phosphatase family metal-dependent hydrolase
MASTLAPMSTTFRLMTANLYDGKVDPSSLAQVLEAVAPDIIICQELEANAAEVIATHFRHADLHPASGYQGRAVAAQIPFESGSLELPARRASLAVFPKGAHPALPDGLDLVGTHLMNPIDRPLRVTAAIRRQQVTGILDYLTRTNVPRVVAGDLNATPLYRSYKRLAGELTDMPKTVGAVRTWGPWPWFPRLLRIDHVFAGGLECAAVHRVNVKGGDHSLLAVDLRSSV